MANTRQDHKALLTALGLQHKSILISIPNKIAKRMQSKNKKTAPKNHWDMLRMFHPKLFLSAMRKMKGGM